MLFELVVLIDIELLLDLSLELLNSIHFGLAVLSESLIALFRIFLVFIISALLFFLLLHHDGTLLDDLSIAILFIVIRLSLDVGSIVILVIISGLLLREVEEAALCWLSHEGWGCSREAHLTERLLLLLDWLEGSWVESSTESCRLCCPLLISHILQGLPLLLLP